MVTELTTVIVILLVAAAELLHDRRCRRVAALAFGPSQRPAVWARVAPLWRVVSLTAITWGLITLLTLPPKVHRAEAVPDNDFRHVLIVLDISPSMRLEDAGPEGRITRMSRAREVMESFFKRVPMEQYRVSVVAVYNGAKPVVIDTMDIDVVRNILGDLPMHHAFVSGDTDLFAGLKEAVKICHPWKPDSTTLILVSDGDTVSATGMPKMPASVRNVLVVGIGDSKNGTFIAGRQSRQDASTLRQIAVRLRGTYHNGNQKHLSSDTIKTLTEQPGESIFERLTQREYALAACTSGSMIYALLPLLLHFFGTAWRPGVPETP